MGNKITISSEPTSMTATLLEENIIQDMACSEDLDITELRKLVKVEGLEHNIVHSLCLGNKGLVNINGLWKFAFLTKLEISNNYLEKIEGLDCLFNLKYLDLSFNFIKHISNLENLTNLIHLNLIANEIDVLENLESLKKLETFLIRNNKIKSFDNIYYLRHFKDLSSLAVDKNPLMLETNKKYHIIAVLPQLKYLDYNFISPDEVSMALKEFPEEQKLLCRDEFKTEGFGCGFPQSDKEAYVEGLSNGQGFQSLLLSDKNYQLLHSFPPASEIANDHFMKVTKIFDKWHEAGHEYYQLIENEKSEFLSMVSKAKEYSLEVTRLEEMKFINFKENITKELCLIYQHSGLDEDDDVKVSDLKSLCEFSLQNAARNFMNSNCLLIDLILNMCKLYEEENHKILSKYILELQKFSEDIMDINIVFAKKLKDFYFEIFEPISNSTPEENSDDQDFFVKNPTFSQLLQNKELIKTSLELSSRIHRTVLEERIKDLKLALYQDIMETVRHVSEDVFTRQNEQTRNAVIFYNKQMCFIDKLFSKNNVFKQYFGYH